MPATGQPHIVRKAGDGTGNRRISLHARPENASAYDEVNGLLLDGMPHQHGGRSRPRHRRLDARSRARIETRNGAMLWHRSAPMATKD